MTEKIDDALPIPDKNLAEYVAAAGVSHKAKERILSVCKIRGIMGKRKGLQNNHIDI